MRKCFIVFKATLFFVKWLQRIKDICINLKGKLIFLYNQQKSHNHQTKCNKKATLRIQGFIQKTNVSWDV